MTERIQVLGPTPFDSSTSESAIWEPTVRIMIDTTDYGAILAESTPSNDVLLELVRHPRNRPPQEWWDDPSDPFEPDDVR